MRSQNKDYSRYPAHFNSHTARCLYFAVIKGVACKGIVHTTFAYSSKFEPLHKQNIFARSMHQ